MLNINNLKNENTSNTSNVVDIAEPSKIVEKDKQKINYAFHQLNNAGHDIYDFMYMNEDNNFWYFKNKFTRNYIKISKSVPSEDLNPSEILQQKVLDTLPVDAVRKTKFVPEIRQLSNGEVVQSAHDYNVLAENLDPDSPYFGEYVHKIGSTLTNDYNYSSIYDKVTMFNDQIADKFSDYLVNLDSLEVNHSTAYNGGFYKANYIFKDIYADIQVNNHEHKTRLFLDVTFSTGLGGIASNNICFKTFDSFCTNGLVFFGKTGLGKLKHTKNSDLDFYMDNSTDSIISNFFDNVELMKTKTELTVTSSQVMRAIELFTKSNFKDLADRKRDTKTLAHSLLDQWELEQANRGSNVFALDSVFTAFSSHGDENRHTVDGFQTRNTGSDHKALTLDKRAVKVHQFLNSPSYKELVKVA